MAGSKSNALETDYLTWALTNAAVTRPTAWYVALYTDAPGIVNDPGPVTEATTANCPGYARQQIGGTTGFTVSGNTAQNPNLASFTATGAWATVNYWGIVDTASGAARLLYWGDMTAQTLANTNKLDFPINSITCNED